MSLPPTAVVGTWRLDRVVTDRLHGETMTVEGTLAISPVDEDRLRWREDGVLRRGGHDAEVFREYALVRRGEGWMMTFDDGRDFHPWSPGAGVLHPCAADTYRGAYDLAALPDRWSVVWEVTGPAKDHRIATSLTSAG